jgi:hypothetical protein
MKKAIKNKCRFINDIDFFGKEPELYYKGKEKRVSWIGRIFTFIYFVLYIIIFVYKLIRMVQKAQGTFYETYAYSGEPPSIHVTNKNFYGGFAVGPSPFIEETIYYPKLEWWRGERIAGEWSWTSKELELERCTLNSFDSRYWNLFNDTPVNDLYCIKDLNETLEGYSHMKTYSYFNVTVYSCKDKTKDGRPCMPPSIIEQFLLKNVFQFYIQDIDLTPHDYYNPSQATQKIISGPIYKNLHQQIYAYMEIIDVQTDNDYLGLSAFTNYNSQKFLKYDESWIISSPNENNETYEYGYPLCEIIIQLSEKVLTQKRSFTKLTEIFGEIGGTMNVVYMVFNFFVSFVASLLYKKSLVNNLFSFDIRNKIIKLKENKNDKVEPLKNEQIKDNQLVPKDDNSLKDSTNNNQDLKNNINNGINQEQNITENKSKDKKTLKRNKKRTNTNFSRIRTLNTSENSDIKSRVIFKNNLMQEEVNTKNSIKEFNLNMNINKKNNFQLKAKRRKSLINKIEFEKLQVFLCFLCIPKRKSVHNYLLNEGIKMVSNKLDILNIFKNMYICEKISVNFNKDGSLEAMDMPEEWTKKIKEYEEKVL